MCIRCSTTPSAVLAATTDGRRPRGPTDVSEPYSSPESITSQGENLLTHSTGMRRAVAATLLPLALLVAGAQPAQAKTQVVKCGATLTEDTKLTKNLTCSGEGLTLAPGVDLDLGGHTLTGDATVDGTAVRVMQGADARISNGTIRAFRDGIRYEGVYDGVTTYTLEIHRLKVVDSLVGLVTGKFSITQSTFRNAPVGMWVADFSATDSTFDRSSISGEMLTITLNRSQVLGSRIGDENTHIKIKNSVLDGSGYEGGPVWCGGGVTLTDSVVRDFVQPIYAYNFCTLDVVGSTFTNLPNGAIVGELADRTHRVSGSTFRQSGVAVQGSSLEITNSTFARNTTGVLVDDPAGSSLTGNVVRDNTEQGIYTTGNGLALRNNTAVRNGGYGIHAPAANDLGGNVARNNGLGNCVGLTCSTR
jgi:parallel beta-helix repeat protein